MSMASETTPPRFEEARQAFEREYATFASTAILDDLRRTEYARLDRTGQVYLDYTGGGLYAESQVELHAALLREHVFGNPHSINPTSLASTRSVEQARAAVLEFFNASPDEYLVIFTANASGALKLVGESYPFAPDSRYVLTFDNHNSVNGIREFARSKGAEFTYVPLTEKELRIDRAAMSAELSRRAPGNNLVAFPAQSNFSGVQHPLDIIDEAHDRGWDVLLDAAAFVPSNRLDLSRWKPDFVCISFYKMFGYPTGVGCLLVRPAMLAKLRRPWFAGGTVQIASVQGDGHYLATDGAAFEDGTVDYLAIPAVTIGLAHLASIGIDVIHERVRCLTGWLLTNLEALRHHNGRWVVEMHGPAGLEKRGGTISFNFHDVNGAAFDMARVQELATAAKISLRTGCFCNPGAGEAAFGLSPEEIRDFFHQGRGMSFEALRRRIHDQFRKDIGALRVSVGLATNFSDVYRFYEFARSFADRTFDDVGTAAGSHSRDGA